MGLIKAKIQFYRSMASMLEAGVPMAKALSRRHSAPFGRIGKEIASGIEHGKGSLSDLMPEHSEAFSLLECQLVAIGEKTGQLDLIFRNQAESFELQKQLKVNIISGLAYPALVYHVAAVLLPLLSFIIAGGTLAGLIFKIILYLAPPYIIWGLWKLSAHARLSMPSEISEISLHIPLAGRLVRQIEYARFFRSYSLATSAGLPASQAVELSANSCSNASVRNAFIKTAKKIESDNCPFTEAYAMFMFSSDRADADMSMMESGELSGKADEAAAHIAKMHREEAEETLKRIANILPKLVYIAIVIYLAISIVGVWSALFKKTSALGF